LRQAAGPVPVCGGERIERNHRVKKYIAILGVALSFAASASAEKEADTTVYGLHLGEKLSLPECQRVLDKKNKATNTYDEDPGPAICFQRRWMDSPVLRQAAAPPDTPFVTAHIQIKFPSSNRPQIGVIPVQYIFGQVIDGNLEEVAISTCGLECQDEALAMLKEKYGEPSSVRDENVENQLGAVFVLRQADWLEFSNLKVSLLGFDSTLHEGLIRIMTLKGFDFRYPQRQATGPKL
jgi:hypothetical protein